MVNKKHTRKSLIGLLLTLGMITQIEAMPMFTKQTGMDCSGCHMQQMPRLNKFGRKFVASGMTMSQKVADLNKTSDMDINPSLILKSKYAQTWDKPDGKGGIKEDDTNDGELSIVRMATLAVGGRISENVGAILNLGWRKEESGSVSGKVVYVNEIEDGYWGVTAYSTSTSGPFSGMEFYNTGLYKPLRMFEMRIYSNADQSTRLGSESATGLQVYYDKDNVISDGDHFFATAGLYAPAQDNLYLEMGDNLLPFARVAYEHPVGDYNLILGAFAIEGGDNVSPSETLSIKRDTYGMDVQVEGDIAEKEATLTLTKVFKNKVEYTGVGAGSIEDFNDVYNDAFSIEGAVSATPDVVLKAGYMTYNDLYEYDKVTKINVKDLDSAISLGLDYGFVVTGTPMKLALEYAWMEPSLQRVADYESFMATLTLPF